MVKLRTLLTILALPLLLAGCVFPGVDNRKQGPFDHRNNLEESMKRKPSRHKGQTYQEIVENTHRDRLKLLKLRAEGANMKEAAAAIGLSLKGADYHWREVCKMVGTSNFALVVQWALYNGYAEWKVGA